jgi:hypothetical protein
MNWSSKVSWNGQRHRRLQEAVPALFGEDFGRVLSFDRDAAKV